MLQFVVHQELYLFYVSQNAKLLMFCCCWTSCFIVHFISLDNFVSRSTDLESRMKSSEKLRHDLRALFAVVLGFDFRINPLSVLTSASIFAWYSKGATLFRFSCNLIYFSWSFVFARAYCFIFALVLLPLRRFAVCLAFCVAWRLTTVKIADRRDRTRPTLTTKNSRDTQSQN